jgi:hypothetical protein
MKMQQSTLTSIIRAWMNTHINGVERICSNMLCGMFTVGGIYQSFQAGPTWLLAIGLCIPTVLWTNRMPGWTFLADFEKERVSDEFLESLAGAIDINDELKILLKEALTDHPDLTYGQMLGLAEEYDGFKKRVSGTGFQSLDSANQPS